jgi:hypothetical protein
MPRQSQARERKWAWPAAILPLRLVRGKELAAALPPLGANHRVRRRFVHGSVALASAPKLMTAQCAYCLSPPEGVPFVPSQADRYSISRRQPQAFIACQGARLVTPVWLAVCSVAAFVASAQIYGRGLRAFSAKA